ncbi:MAG: ThuA domain-containing protein, partial [Planctomycetota bacterium]|nr:ThuA domain-containing protein [Planctomycetota bacterium]
ETAEKAGWRVTVMIGDYKTLDSKGHPVKQPQKPVARGKTPEAIQRYERVMKEIRAQKPLTERMKEKDFGKGYDAIVYNFCLAHVTDLEATANVIRQTRENGVPAFLIHCSMHSFWSTFRYRDKQKVLMEQWQEKYPDREFPNWGKFTGVASTGHGPNYPITTTRLVDHPATRGVAGGYVTPPTELYNNHFVTEGTTPLLLGRQSYERKLKDGTTKKIETESVIMWVSRQGKSRVMGLTIGHGDADLRSKGFQSLLIDGVNWMVESGPLEGKSK